jgi:hypothetical protein
MTDHEIEIILAFTAGFACAVFITLAVCIGG